jgi:hypothetical protein
MTNEPSLRRGLSLPPVVCQSPMQIVVMVRQYFVLHLQEFIDISNLHALLGISKHCHLESGFKQVRGVSLAQALQENRLNRLLASLTDHPCQGLGHAIEACGLTKTKGVVALFEQAFGIEMSFFMLTCRRAADDRLFRMRHPDPEALVLPT